jgi:hypothetical protein
MGQVGSGGTGETHSILAPFLANRAGFRAAEPLPAPALLGSAEPVLGRPIGSKNKKRKHKNLLLLLLNGDFDFNSYRLVSHHFYLRGVLACHNVSRDTSTIG